MVMMVTRVARGGVNYLYCTGKTRVGAGEGGNAGGPTRVAKVTVPT